MFLEKLTSQGLAIRTVMCYHITVLKQWRTSKQSRGAQELAIAEGRIDLPEVREGGFLLLR